MSVPVLLIVLALEGDPTFVTLADEPEESRLSDWLRSTPGVAELIDAAMQLAKVG